MTFFMTRSSAMQYFSKINGVHLNMFVGVYQRVSVKVGAIVKLARHKATF